MKAVPPTYAHTLSSLSERPADPASCFARSGAFTFYWMISGGAGDACRHCASSGGGLGQHRRQLADQRHRVEIIMHERLTHDSLKAGIAVGRELLCRLIERRHDP